MRSISLLSFLIWTTSAFAGQDSGVGIFDSDHNFLLARISPESAKGADYFDVIYCGGGAVLLANCEGPTQPIQTSWVRESWKEHVEDELKQTYQEPIDQLEATRTELEAKLSATQAKKAAVIGQLDRELQEIDKALADPALSEPEQTRLSKAREAKEADRFVAKRDFDKAIAELNQKLKDNSSYIQGYKKELDQKRKLHAAFQKSLEAALAGGKATYLDMRDETEIAPKFFYFLQRPLVKTNWLEPRVISWDGGSYQHYSQKISGDFSRPAMIWIYRVYEGACAFETPELILGPLNYRPLKPTFSSPPERWEEQVRDGSGGYRTAYMRAEQDYYLLDPLIANDPMTLEFTASKPRGQNRVERCDPRTTEVYFHISR